MPSPLDPFSFRPNDQIAIIHTVQMDRDGNIQPGTPVTRRKYNVRIILNKYIGRPIVCEYVAVARPKLRVSGSTTRNSSIRFIFFCV
jgi:hypothetical protein